MQVGINKNILVAYFSRKGQNYVNGKIVNLPIGNTEVVAKMIQKITGSGIFHIEGKFKQTTQKSHKILSGV
jgi:flavodoxin